MPEELRKSGIDVLGSMPWGTHFCHFYETKQDLLDILVPYFRTGLENNEFCLWVTSNPLTVEKATRALRQAVPDFERYLAKHAIEILPYAHWYLKGKAFRPQRVIDGWHRKLNRALARGYVGMRVNGNEAWLKREIWKDFVEYERELNKSIAGKRIIVLCTYPLRKCEAADILDVARAHDRAITKRGGWWMVVEIPELKQTKEEIKRLNAKLERRVAERTRELAATTQELRQEISERKLAEEERERLLHRVEQAKDRLQLMSLWLMDAQEAERRRIARELHDEVGQTLTALKLGLQMSEKQPEIVRKEYLRDAAQRVDELLAQVRNISLDLRPTMLDDLGLLPALLWHFERFTTMTSVRVDIQHSGLENRRFPAEIETVAYRIVQEALTNVVRHAGVEEVVVRVWANENLLGVEVEDHGKGFDAAAAMSSPISSGLSGMRERVTLFGGEFAIESVPGQGTRLRVSLPLHKGEPA